jgi:hypothetical protein
VIIMADRNKQNQQPTFDQENTQDENFSNPAQTSEGGQNSNPKLAELDQKRTSGQDLTQEEQAEYRRLEGREGTTSPSDEETQETEAQGKTDAEEGEFLEQPE